MSTHRHRRFPRAAAFVPLLVLAARPAAVRAGDGTSGGPWKALVGIGDVLHLGGWDGTRVTLPGGAAGTVEREFSGTSTVADGAYLAGYATLDPHVQLGGFVYFLGLGLAAARSDDGDTFYRTLSLVGFGVSAKGGARVHRVVWLGAALDVGLAVVVPRDATLAREAAGLDAGTWYGLFLFPRLHADIIPTGRDEPGLGFFGELGPLLIPVARGSGTWRDGSSPPGFSTWWIGVQLVLGFILAG